MSNLDALDITLRGAFLKEYSKEFNNYYISLQSINFQHKVNKENNLNILECL